MKYMDHAFDALPWHDATLLGLAVNRLRAGEQDVVRLCVLWPDGRQSAITFSDCFGLSVEMNFGNIADESISTASSSGDEDGLVAIRERWSRTGVALVALRCYRIETSSTGSVIYIYALSHQIESA